MSFHRSPKGLRQRCPHSLLISKPLYCCMDACRWHYLPFSSWLELSLLYLADQAGACGNGIPHASRRYSRYHHSIFNSRRHGCVDIALPPSKTIGNSLHIIISYYPLSHVASLRACCNMACLISLNRGHHSNGQVYMESLTRYSD